MKFNGNIVSLNALLGTGESSGLGQRKLSNSGQFGFIMMIVWCTILFISKFLSSLPKNRETNRDSISFDTSGLSAQD